MYKNLRTELADWTEINNAIDIVATCLGLLETGKQFPKHMYWSNNATVDAINSLILKLVESGVLEKREEDTDIEVRWNPYFYPEW